MAPAAAPSELAVLRSISFHIASAPVSSLPRTVALRVHALKQCKNLLSQPRSSSTAGGEAGVVLHRFHTQISTLLQGRSVEQRWAAAVLIKAAVEAGGYEMLQAAKHWVPGLLSNLRRPEPSLLKVINISTLTRIFILTWPYPSLVREITTPSLPPFIKTALASASALHASERERQAVLECFGRLLPRHTTIFRTFVNDIEKFVGAHLSSSSEHRAATVKTSISETRTLAGRLSVLLHSCEPKQGATTSWGNKYVALVQDLSSTLGKLLFDVEEQSDQESSAAVTKIAGAAYMRGLSTDQRCKESADLAVKVVDGLQLITSYVYTDIGTVSALPLRDTFDVLQRILSVMAGKDLASQGPRFGSQSTINERDVVIVALPGLHIAALEFLQALIIRFHTAAPGMASAAVDLLDWTFRAEGHMEDVRSAVYSATEIVLSKHGSSLGRELVQQLKDIVEAASRDLQISTSPEDGKSISGPRKAPEELLKKKESIESNKETLSLLQQTAARLITAVYTHISSPLLPDPVWNRMARAVILSQQKDALLASVLHHGNDRSGPAAASLLPFLARQGRFEPAVEALLRPRLPVLVTGRVSEHDLQPDGNHDQSIDMDSELVSQQLTRELEDDLVRDASNSGATHSPHRPIKRPGDEVTAVSHSEDKRLRVEANSVPDLGQDLVRVADSTLPAPLEPVQLSSLESPVEQAQQLASFTGFDRTRSQDEGESFRPAPSSTQQPTQVVSRSVAVEESDDENFVIPDLTMDVSDSEEEEDS